ncbi:SDR family NAD(P)-dependent oxidoreductase [Kribbella italica]|uniref:NAD(P)-dependent dehydrogenase (Short-subunit alcohol dehydrogenase family) n=1 Tax=Kribbella italica TaxID=1540520 RepID=A0A7W9JBT7_9ACTN|nr:SDR family oxidoreductase [Kribbella italica]MBB5839276.1 NAD(P)-dependent dehydrogenase (short-subunit alcohol dehydrogenase family) [Kribbella italica]
MTPSQNRPVAVVTGASAGLGLALAQGLAERGWSLIIDARGADALKDAADQLAAKTDVVPLAGDVTDAEHRADLVDAVGELGRLDLLVNNASYLGPSPLQPLAAADLDELRRVYEVDVIAPIALAQALIPELGKANGIVLNVSSDAAVEAYEGWGGYGSAKAALDHASAVLAAEHPGLAVYAVDPGDLRTAMHQAAFPGEDISDRPEPAAVVPALLALLDSRPASGRYRASEFAPAEAS